VRCLQYHDSTIGTYGFRVGRGESTGSGFAKVRLHHPPPLPNTAVSGSYDHSVRVWDVERGVEKGILGKAHTSHAGIVFGLQYSPEESVVIRSVPPASAHHSHQQLTFEWSWPCVVCRVSCA
jgi:WD40 repeat protein